MTFINLPRAIATSGLFAAAFGFAGALSASAADDNVTVPKAALEELQAQNQATEQTASELLKAVRDWRAKAIQFNSTAITLQTQLAEAKKACPTPAESPKQ